MPLTLMQELDSEADRFETPCGEGAMVWRRWGVGEDRVPVLLLHGGSGSWTHWIKTIPALKSEFEVWAIDIPGLGESAMPASPFVPQSCADAIVAGFRQLFSPNRKARLVGFSFGCQVGVLAALDLLQALSGIVIVGTAALGRGPQIRPLPKERSSMSIADRREVHRRVLEILMFWNPEWIDEQAIALQAINVSNARFRSREFAGGSAVRDGLAQIDLPLRTIWGRHDVIANPDLDTVLKILAEKHPELKACIIEEAGHWVMYEAPEAFNASLLEFLRN
ncbi:MAG: alpha/beta fold hydrolase [Hyphomicrobiaceae bacterium]